MAKRQRARKSPAGRAGEMASGVSLLTLVLVLFAAWPLILPGWPIQATSVGLAIAGIIASGFAWLWALRVMRGQNAAGKRLDELQALSPDAFEEWVAARFRERGYAVEIVGAQGDHGIDLVAVRADEPSCSARTTARGRLVSRCCAIYSARCTILTPTTRTW